MQYISPLHFVALSPAGTIDRKDILLAKKKMLAELELNDGKGIEINGKEVSKNDIIRFFDDLQQSDDLPWHLAVYKDPVLLKFLEYNTLENNDRFAGNPLYTDASFINWLSPYYAHSFTVFATECIGDMMSEEWATLLNNPLLMNSYNQETAWESLDKSLEADISRLQVYADRKVMSQAELNGISGLCDFTYIMMLERLPEERFRRLRDEMAFTIMQVCITAFNHTNRGWALDTIDNAHTLAVTEELKTQILDKKAEMESLSAGRSGNSSNKVQLWTIVRIALFVLFVGTRFFNNCNSSDNYEFQRNTPVIFTTPNDTTLKKLQEEMKKMNNSDRGPLSDSAAKKSIQDLMKTPDKSRPPL